MKTNQYLIQPAAIPPIGTPVFHDNDSTMAIGFVESIVEDQARIVLFDAVEDSDLPEGAIAVGVVDEIVTLAETIEKSDPIVKDWWRTVISSQTDQ